MFACVLMVSLAKAAPMVRNCLHLYPCCTDVSTSQIVHFFISFLEIIRTCPTPEPDVDFCANSPCQNNGTCYNTTGDYVCVCLDSFEGKNCSSGKIPCVLFEEGDFHYSLSHSTVKDIIQLI